MKRVEDSRFNLVLGCTMCLMGMIVIAICLVDNTKAVFLLYSTFSAGCTAIFGLLRRQQ
jgi:hypothetical protein